MSDGRDKQQTAPQLRQQRRKAGNSSLKFTVAVAGHNITLRHAHCAVSIDAPICSILQVSSWLLFAASTNHQAQYARPACSIVYQL